MRHSPLVKLSMLLFLLAQGLVIHLLMRKETRLETSWVWYKFSVAGNCTLPTKRSTLDGRRLLVAQYSGLGDAYSELLEVASVASMAYARKWGVDFLRMQGVAMGSKPAHATYNKIEVLRRAIDAPEKYDALLLLDSDAIIVDLDLDFLELIPENMMISAQPVATDPHTWDINIGVTLWNLRHDDTESIVDEWRRLSLWDIGRFFNTIDDQRPLQEVLRKRSPEQRSKMINALKSPHFWYQHGTAVKHMVRSRTDWTGRENENRLQELQKIRDETCAKFAPFCME